ncbi:NADH-quinone oxidoreductase subunit E [Neorhizobium galegae]|uniref:5' DNA nuclease n=1 Tax=Neorhizobium galegae TaxID=399 RepID=UPI001AE8796F|nr:5' DNA nuclease [Neorhizobium galegae]MBP2547247.1 NADH-quinone oxidoreductase subunit E [Neorhizobium galegae]
MADGPDKKDKDQAADKSPLGFTLPFADEASAKSLHNPMAAMAAATAAGMAIGAQFANAFFGMMQASMEAATRPAPEAKAKAPETAPQPEAKVEAAAPETQATPVTAKPAPVRKAAKPAAKAESAVETAKAVPQPKPVRAAKAKAKVVATPPAKAEKPEKPAGTKAGAKAQPKRQKAADDLKTIAGIGPKLADMLNGMGVTRFAQIAAWTDEDVAHFDRELELDGRIAKDGWIAQAKKLLR